MSATVAIKEKRALPGGGAGQEGMLILPEDLLDFVAVPRPDGASPAWRIARRFRKAQGAGLGKPGLVWLPGFNSDMLGAKASRVDDWAREHGRAFLRFDYSGHGESDGRFEDGSIGDWLEQSLALIDASTQGPQILIGTSMGAWIALLVARRLAARGETNRLHGLILLAPAVDFTEELMWKLLPRDALRDLETKGVWMRPSEYSPEPTPITRRLIEEARANHLLMGGVIRAHAPVQILQGLEDADVPWSHAVAVVEHMAGDPVALSFIAGGDHRLSREEDMARLIATIEGVA